MVRNINGKLLFLLLLTSFVAIFPQAAKKEKAFLDNALAFYEQAAFDKAIAELDKALRLNPSNPNALLMRADCKWRRGDAQSALRDYDSAIKLGPRASGAAIAYNDRAILRQEMGDERGALSDYENAIALDPKFADAYNGRGILHYKNGHPGLALADFNRAIALDPKIAAPYFGRSIIRLQRNELEPALSDVNKGIELYGGLAGPYMVRGTILGLKNRWEMAVADFRKAFETNKPDLGGLVIAFSDVDRYIASNPGNARAYAVRGFINLLRGKSREGEQDLKKSFELDPGLRKELRDLVESVKERPA